MPWAHETNAAAVNTTASSERLTATRIDSRPQAARNVPRTFFFHAALQLRDLPRAKKGSLDLADPGQPRSRPLSYSARPSARVQSRSPLDALLEPLVAEFASGFSSNGGSWPSFSAAGHPAFREYLVRRETAPSWPARDSSNPGGPKRPSCRESPPRLESRWGPSLS